MNQLINSQVSK